MPSDFFWEKAIGLHSMGVIKPLKMRKLLELQLEATLSHAPECAFQRGSGHQSLSSLLYARSILCVKITVSWCLCPLLLDANECLNGKKSELNCNQSWNLNTQCQERKTALNLKI